MAKKNKKKAEFTVKQQRFIDFYNGNATEAAKKAGYKHPNKTGPRLLVNVGILEAIRAREKQRLIDEIATRAERQIFWTQVMKGEVKSEVIIGRGDDREIIEVDTPLRDRLRASELLGRSEADFTDNIKVREVKPLIIFDEDE